MKTIGVTLGLLLVTRLPSIPPTQAPGSFVQPCLAAAADASPVYPTSVFPSAVGEIDAAFHLGEGEHFERLVATWVAVDVGPAMPPHYTLGSSELRLAPGATAGVFRYELEWFPPGRYRVDINADGQPWKSAELRVVPDVAGMSRLAGLMPLTAGKVWTYKFVQEVGELATVAGAPAGSTLDTAGRVHATVTATIASTDDHGTHVSWARGGVPFSDEWWLVGHGGFAAVKRSAEDESLVLDPPQVFFPWPVPVVMGAEWIYVSRDETVRQSYRIWGPLPIKGPDGDAPGYVVLVEQRSPMATATVEREYLPGVGMVRSLAIAGFGTETVNREELVLTGVQ